MSSSGFQSGPNAPTGPQVALDALLARPEGRPLRRALWLEALDQRLRPCLPQPLSAHARLANVDGDRLVFVVDAAAWHTRLRLAAPRLLDQARSLGLRVGTLVIKIRASDTADSGRQPPRRAKPMSEASRQALQAALDTLRPAAPTDTDISADEPGRTRMPDALRHGSGFRQQRGHGNG